jgi:hypothetical protein
MRIGSSWNWPLTAVVVWLGILLGFAIHGYFHPYSHTVFDIYGPAARNWWAGRDLYKPTTKSWLEGHGFVAQATDYYRYCPLFAVAVTPFAVLPPNLGNPLWKVFNCVLFGWSLWVASRRLFPGMLYSRQLAAVFLLALPLSVHSMYNGQANLIVVGSILLGLTAVAEERWNAAAIWLALGTLIKGYPLALGLLLVVLHPRRFPLRYVAAVIGGLVLPLAMQRPALALEQTRHWLDHMQDSTELMRERLRSIDKVLEVCGFPVCPATFALMGLAAGGIVLCLCLVHYCQIAQPRERLKRVLELFCLWVVLFGPATEACTYVVMAPIVAWNLVEAFQRPTGWTRRVLLVCSLVLMGPIATDLFGPAIRVLANRYGSQPIGALVFLTFLATCWNPFQARSSRRAPNTPTWRSNRRAVRIDQRVFSFVIQWPEVFPHEQRIRPARDDRANENQDSRSDQVASPAAVQRHPGK